MGLNKRFNNIRAIPTGDSANSPGFFHYNISNMRQIATMNHSVTATGLAQSYVTIFLPGNSWGLGKALICRSIVRFVIPLAGMPPVYNVLEGVSLPNAPGILYPTGPAFVPVPGVYTTMIQRSLIRLDPNILTYDLGNCLAHHWMNQDDNIAHVLSVAPLIAPFDYTPPINIDLQFTMPLAPAGCTITNIWSEAFLEQGSNLGKLP